MSQGVGLVGSCQLCDQGRVQDIVVVGYELMDATRLRLVDGTLNFLISHPPKPPSRSNDSSHVDSYLQFYTLVFSALTLIGYYTKSRFRIIILFV